MTSQCRSCLQHTVGTSEFARADLQKRLDREKKEHSRLQRSITRQAAEWVQVRKEMQEHDDGRRWTAVRDSRSSNAVSNVGPTISIVTSLLQVTQVSPYDGDMRMYMHATKKNTDQPRQMYTSQGRQ